MIDTIARTGAVGVARVHSFERWRVATIAVLVGLTILVAATFRDYGVTHDEFVQHTYGQLLWRLYLSGFRDTAVFDYIDLYRYGGLFDLIETGLAPFLPFAPYETRHLVSAMIGILGIAGTGRLAALMGGPRAEFFAVALLALSASYYGSMFNNTKDIPFAAGMVWTLYYGLRVVSALPKPSLAHALAFGAAFGLTLGIRVGVLMLPVYLVAGMALWFWDRARRIGLAECFSDLAQAVVRLVPGAILAYAIMAAVWPWAVLQPLNPIRALMFFSHHPIVIKSQIFGLPIVSSETPWFYIPGYLLVKLPEATIAFLCIGTVLLVHRIWRDRGDARAHAAMLLMAVFVPLVMFIVFRPTVFNGLRHFFFVVPPLTAIAALGLDALWARAEAAWRGWRWALGVVLAVYGALQIWLNAGLHPNQYVYYNAIAGGVAGAERRFEMDYWSNSIREAAILLTDFVRAETGGQPPENPYRVALCSERESFFEHVPEGYFVLASEWAQGEFFVAPTQMNCDRAHDGALIIVVERLGALLAVVKDRRDLTR